MRFHISILFVLAPLILDAEIRSELSQYECLPGDPIEYRATSSYDAFKTFEIIFPKNDNIHIVARRKEPVQFENQKYTQSETWILQSLSPGEIIFDKIQARVSEGGESKIIPLEPLTLRVNSYSENYVETFKPEPFPQSVPQDSTPPYPYFIFLFIAVTLGTIYILRTRKNTLIEQTPVREQDPFQPINRELEAGQIPHHRIGALLSDSRIELRQSTRIILEKSIFAARQDPQKILESLRQSLKQ